MCKKGLFPKAGIKDTMVSHCYIDDLITNLVLLTDKGNLGQIYILATEQSIGFYESVRLIANEWIRPFGIWTLFGQLFAYQNDGSYSIDNSIAERFIRPLAGEWKNSLFFGSDKMARVSAVYHTIISTCQMQGVSVLGYFKKFFG